MIRMQRRLCIVIIFLGMAFFARQNMWAKDATPSAVTPSQKIKDQAKERLLGEQDSGEEIKPPKPPYFGYFGTLAGYHNQTLTLQDTDTIRITVKDDTVITAVSGGVKTTLADADLPGKKGAFLLAIGSKNTNGDEVSASRISFFTKPKSASERKIISGLVTEVENNRLMVKTADKTEAVLVNSATKIMSDTAQKLTIDDVLIDDKIVGVYRMIGSGNTALKILVIPGKKNPVSLENLINASQSATATLSATPTK